MNRDRDRGSFLHAMAVVGACCFLLAGCDRSESPVELPPPAPLSELFGEHLYLADGTTVGLETVAGTPVIGIYFAAATCPACGSFTPLLRHTYNQLRDQSRAFEVVLVSSDGSAPCMFRHMQESNMPWLALPWRGPHANALTQRYDVRWIPTLVIIDGNGATITLNGHEDLSRKGIEAFDDWLAASTSS